MLPRGRGGRTGGHLRAAPPDDRASGAAPQPGPRPGEAIGFGAGWASRRPPPRPPPPAPGRSPARSTGPASAEHCRVAYLRGRFLAHGSLSLASGRTHLEFVLPVEEARELCERLRQFEMAATWRVRRGRGVVTWKSVRDRRHVPAAGRRRSGAARAGGAPGLALGPRRPEPRHQRRVGQPAAGRGRRGAPARGDRDARRRTAAWPSSRTWSGSSPTPAARSPRPRSPSSPSGSVCTARPCSAPWSGSSGWRCTRTREWGSGRRGRRGIGPTDTPARPIGRRARGRTSLRATGLHSVIIPGHETTDHCRQLEDEHHPRGRWRAGRDNRRPDRGAGRGPSHLPALRLPGRRPRRAGRHERGRRSPERPPRAGRRLHRRDLRRRC